MFKIWSSLFLIVCAVIDIKTNKVVQSFCIINYILSLIVKAFLNELDIFVLIVGVIICGILFSISVPFVSISSVPSPTQLFIDILCP